MKRNYADENSRALYEKTLEDPSLFPFVFRYDGAPFRGFCSPVLTPAGRETRKQGVKTTNTLVWDLKGELKLTLVYSFYESHGATEWYVEFENVSDSDSGVISDWAAEMEFEGEKPLLRGIYGDHVKYYEPYEFDLEKQNVHFESNEGRATHVNFPYFDLVYGSGGAMLAIGWAGTWSADFVRTGTGVSYRARSVNRLETYLRPGEKIRTALFVRAPYAKRDEFYAVNYWRNFFTERILAKGDARGEPVEPFSTCCFAFDTGRRNSDGSISEGHDSWKRSFDKLLKERLDIDFRWIDAGWYQRPDLGSAVPVRYRDWWESIGTWVPDPAKWPGDSLLQSTQYARDHGMKTLMWFEPERVTDPENLAKNFGYDINWAVWRGEKPPRADICDKSTVISNNIGDPACFEYTVGRICKTLSENRIEMYREDNNSDPAALWDLLDSREGAGRRGITECKFIQAHYAMWDRIIACTLSYGGCGFLDSCASGGGRNDIESMKRSVPMLRSDHDRTSTAIRLSMTTSFNKWLPFCGANTREKLSELAPTGNSDVYVWRASYLPVLNVDSQYYFAPEDYDFGGMRKGIAEWKKVSPYLLKELYVLTPWHSEKDTGGFTAYAFFDPEKEEGALLAFRQETCEESELELELPFTEGCEYRLTDEDTGDVFDVSSTLKLSFEKPRTARLLMIKRK